MVSVIDQINTWVHIPVANPSIGGHVGVPLRGLSPDEVIHFPRLWIFSHRTRIPGRSQQLKLQCGIHRPLGFVRSSRKARRLHWRRLVWTQRSEEHTSELQ